MPLPFRTAPKQQTRVVGDPTIGELVFPVHGALLAGERLAIDEVLVPAGEVGWCTSCKAFNVLLPAGMHARLREEVREC